MKHTIRKIDEPVPVMGIVHFGENKNGEIADLWKEFHELEPMIPKSKDGVWYGLCYHQGKQPSEAFHYMIGVPVATLQAIPMPFVAKTIPSGTYAVFASESIEKIKDVYRQIDDFFSSGAYKRIRSYDFELYTGSSENIEICIPIEADEQNQ